MITDWAYFHNQSVVRDRAERHLDVQTFLAFWHALHKPQFVEFENDLNC